MIKSSMIVIIVVHIFISLKGTALITVLLFLFPFPTTKHHNVVWNWWAQIGSFLQPVQVPLNGGSALDCIDHLSQFGVIHKLIESHMQVVKEDTKKKYWSQYWSLGTSVATGCKLSSVPLITTSQNREAPAEVKIFMSGKIYCPELRELWHLRGSRAEPASSQVSCYTPRPFFFKLSWKWQVLSCYQSEYLTGVMLKRYRWSSIFQFSWQRVYPRKCRISPSKLHFKKLWLFFLREKKNKHAVLKMTFTV